MSKHFVKISLAAKCRVLFGAALILIIGSALAVAWTYIKAMVHEREQPAGGEVTRMYLNEWVATHPQGRRPELVPRLFTADDASGLRAGPVFVRVSGQELRNGPDARDSQALRSFLRNPGEDLVQLHVPQERGRATYHHYRAVRVTPACMACHGDKAEPHHQLKPASLVGMVRTVRPAEASRMYLAVSRLVLIGAGLLAFLLAILTFYYITTRLILSPVRRLKEAAERVAEGDLTARSEIHTGDEFEQLGRSFDGMLESVVRTQDQLRRVNRALDTKLNELAEANVALYESNRVKSEFLANVSHELRTPLNSIIGFAELLGESDEDPRVRRYGGNILASARMLLRIINDLLELARIEAGKAPVTISRVSLSDICETLVSLTSPLANKKNLTFTLSLDKQTPIVTTDAGKVQQILYNLLSNAIKFTPPGGSVTLRSHYDESAEQVSISVADTGPGISLAEQEHIFEKFYQLDQSVTREHGGTGLGLAIARELTHLLGGELRLVSQPGEGATFMLVLPVRIPEPQPAPAPIDPE